MAGRDKKPEYKEDCFAIRIHAGHGTCVALTEIDCRNCSFYKSKEQHKEELEKYPPAAWFKGFRT